jgi:hypothetical protein
LGYSKKLENLRHADALLLGGISTSGEYTAHTGKHQPIKPDCQKNPMIIADLLSATI